MTVQDKPSWRGFSQSPGDCKSCITLHLSRGQLKESPIPFCAVLWPFSSLQNPTPSAAREHNTANTANRAVGFLSLPLSREWCECSRVSLARIVDVVKYSHVREGRVNNTCLKNRKTITNHNSIGACKIHSTTTSCPKQKNQVFCTNKFYWL